MQTGSDETSVSLKHNLLDEKLSYHFAVTSLTVPLNNAPIFKVAVDTEIVRIGRRNAGNSLAVDADVTIAPAYPAYVADDNRKFYDVTTFVRDLNSWARGFEMYQTLIGIPNLAAYGGIGNVPVGPLIQLPAKTAAGIANTGTYSFLKFKMSPDGRLSVVGSTHFFNNFFLRFTAFGAALLGFSKEVHSVPNVGIGPFVADYYIAFTTTAAGVQTNTQAGWVDPANGYNILQGNNTKDATVTANSPLYQIADQRVSISVESHLPTASNIAISDQKETVDRTIVEKFFESQLECTVNFDQDGTFSSQQITSNIYSGQVAFVKKSDRHTQWHRLLSAYQLSYFRFHLFITYRRYNSVTNAWSLKREALKVPDDKYWEMEVRFISDT
jgi:hypothetical protein